MQRRRYRQTITFSDSKSTHILLLLFFCLCCRFGFSDNRDLVPIREHPYQARIALIERTQSRRHLVVWLAAPPAPTPVPLGASRMQNVGNRWRMVLLIFLPWKWMSVRHLRPIKSEPEFPPPPPQFRHSIAPPQRFSPPHPNQLWHN